MIDVEFDVRTDSKDKDPDSASKTLNNFTKCFGVKNFRMVII